MAGVTTTLLNVVVLAALAAPSALSVLACSDSGETVAGEKPPNEQDVQPLSEQEMQRFVRWWALKQTISAGTVGWEFRPCKISWMLG